MEFNLYKLFYLGLRFAPFILMSYLTGLIFIQQDLRVMIFMSGLILNCLVVILFGNYVATFQWTYSSSSTDDKSSCNVLNLTGGPPLSFFPLSLVIYSYAISYLMYIIIMEPASIQMFVLMENMTILLFLLFLSFLEFIWLLVFCTFWWKLISALALGGIFGMFWSFLVSKTSLAIYQANTVVRPNDCIMIAENVFRCRGAWRTPTTPLGWVMGEIL